MKDFLLNWVLTASALTAAVILLRAVFGGKISARLRYALWAVALARLLVPGQFYTAPVEAPRVLPEIRTMQTLPVGRTFQAEAPVTAPGGETASPERAVPAPAGEEHVSAPAAQRSPDSLALLGGVWLAGSAAVAAAFLISNWSFSRRLRRVRVPLAAADCPLSVYTAAGLPSPCLFGVFRPAVYVTPEASASPAVLRHVLIHETTHYRQGDHIWSALRCAALAAHWWNPLVWLAAILSRRDAELACDEGTLKVLGDGERRAYGETLLSLVTAKAQPGDLLRCATTMTGDKRSLRERVRRIAKAPKRWLWAAVVTIALAALVCACSFAKTETPESHEDGPLTAEELARFNTEVFNGEGFNMMNQLLFQAAETPEDYKRIDLYQLFYNGTGEPMEITEEERRAVADAGYDGQDPGIDLVKCPRVRMDAVLQVYLGLGLDETDKQGLDLFTFLPEYDAYYDFHGDTNYPGEVTFTSGEWKDGKVLLYYEGSGFPGLSDGEGQFYFASGPACVTLEPQEDGGHHFLSNWHRGRDNGLSAVPTVYPDWEPELVIPLDALEPYEPETVTVERNGGEEDEEAFTDLFGQMGLRVSYYGQLDEHSYGEINDFYTFAEDGTPSLLLRAKGNMTVADLDGDGADEVAASDGWNVSQLFFQRDGQIYMADLYALIHDAWPEAGYMTHGYWDPDGRYLSMSVELPLDGTDVTVTGYRTLFFDGENLRIYKNNDPYTGHLAQGLDALPEEVLTEAVLFVEGQFDALAAEGYGTDGSGRYDEGNFGSGNVVWDDWRITGLSGPYYEMAGPLTVEIWNVSYETHTTTPDRVMLAGGSYLGEDGWCMIGYPGCDYLYFRVEDGGGRTFLYSTMENDCAPGSEMFLSNMVNTLTDMGFLKLSDLTGQTLARVMWPRSAQFLNNLAEGDALERDKALSALGAYFTQEEGMAEYADFAEELNGYRAGELTEGGRAAWEKLRGFVDWFTPDPESSAARAQEMLENEGRVSEMSLPELLEYAAQSDGATAESAFFTLHQRFSEDPAAVLSALAAREDALPLAHMLGATIYWNEDLFPGALERAQALDLSGEEAALRDCVAAACEAAAS